MGIFLFAYMIILKSITLQCGQTQTLMISYSIHGQHAVLFILVLLRQIFETCKNCQQFLLSFILRLKYGVTYSGPNVEILCSQNPNISFELLKQLLECDYEYQY